MDFPFENAKWIGNAACPADASPVFRRKFDWTGPDAKLCISGLGFYALKVNGREWEDEILSPAFSRYDKTVYYNEIDIAPYLHAGENEIEVTLGNGWYNEQQETDWQYEHAIWKNSPRMIAALYAGGECALRSDSKWETVLSATTFNSLRCGETFDARIVPENWARASVVSAPGGVMKKQETQPIRLINVLEPKQILPENNSFICDFGVNTTGNVEICVEGPRGATVEIQYAEMLLPNGFLSLELINQYVRLNRFQKDEYILSGEGEEIWHSRFGYNGFRYAQVRAPKGCTVHYARAREFHTDLPCAGGIETSNETISRIQAAILRSTRTNFHHMPTDCPHREKNGWTGDAWLSSRQMCMNFDMQKVFIKWLDDIVDAQRDSGQIPCIVPTSSWGYAWGCGITWDIALIAIPWELYQATGDIEILRRYAGPIAKYLGHLWDMLDDGIPANGLGDWTAPMETDLIPDGALRAAMAVYAGEMASDIGEILEDDALCAIAAKVGAECEQAFAREYGEIEMPDCQLLHALKLRFGLTDDVVGTAEKLIASLEKTNWHVLGGIFTARFVPEALSMLGRKDILWKVISAKGYPGWDDLAQKCAGTLGENWHGGTSMNHHMYSSIGANFYADLAGIEVLVAGYENVVISPYIPEDLPDFKAWRETPYGKLCVGWKDGTLTISVPHGCQATLMTQFDMIELHDGENSFPVSEIQ